MLKKLLLGAAVSGGALLLWNTTASAQEVPVEPGDHLWALVEGRYGEATPDSVCSVAEVNGLADPNLIYAGTTLSMPDDLPECDGTSSGEPDQAVSEESADEPADTQVSSGGHTVQPGEHLFSIVESRYGGANMDLVCGVAKANGLAGPNSLPAGITLSFPPIGELDTGCYEAPAPAPETSTSSSSNTESAPAPASAPAPEPEPAPAAPAVSSGSVWDSLAQCESGGNWSINTGNGYYGGLQFALSTWQSMGGSGYPHENSREEQIRIAERTLAAGGWGQWPACSSKLGLR